MACLHPNLNMGAEELAEMLEEPLLASSRAHVAESVNGVLEEDAVNGVEEVDPVMVFRWTPVGSDEQQVWTPSTALFSVQKDV